VRPVVYGDPAILRRAALVTGASLSVSARADAKDRADRRRGGSSLTRRRSPSGAPPSPAPWRWQGTSGPRRGRSLRGGLAIVTCPITKEGLKAAGVPYPGHTEFLAHLCGGADVVMMLAGDVARPLVTIHVGLRRLLNSLSALIEKTVAITDTFFEGTWRPPPAIP